MRPAPQSQEASVIEMSGRGALGAEVGARHRPRWRILRSKAAYAILDESLPPEGGDEVARHVLMIDRWSGCAVESRRSVAQVLEELGGLKGQASGAGCGDGGKEADFDACCAAHGSKPLRDTGLRAYAILGVLSVEGVSALLIVTEAECVCKVDGMVIYEVAAVDRLPIASSQSATADAAFDGVLKLLCGKGFYFSLSVDITHTLQWKTRLKEASGATFEATSDSYDACLDLVAAAEPRFVWNRRLIEQLTRQDGVTTRWFVPLMQGHVQVAECRQPHPENLGWDLLLTLLLISRRGSGRAGTRYNARGLDDNGDVANLIETEQLVRFSLTTSSLEAGPCPAGCPQGWLSLVQLRGSVPLFWEQSPQGPVQLTREPQLAAPAFERHQRSIGDPYEGRVFYLNLLSGGYGEQLLTDALERQLGVGNNADTDGDAPSLYCHFDFHAQVKGASQAEFDAELEGLLGEIEAFLTPSGSFDLTAESPSEPATSPRQWQVGVLRTNCLDCLDRTNVVQFYIVWHWLRRFCRKHPALQGMLEAVAAEQPAEQDDWANASVLQKAGASLYDGSAALMQKAGEGLGFLTGGGGGATDDSNDRQGDDRTPVLRHLLQNLWADHGDRVSQQYTGAGSIMSSLLRHGRMTSYTMLERSWQGINRAYQASFQDSQRQECIDLLLGLHRGVTDLPCLRGRGAESSGSNQRSPVGKITVWVGTWNLNGREETWAEQGDVEAWLGPEAADIVVVCVQELVKLNATSIVLLAQGDDVRSAHFEAAVHRALALRGEYVRVRSIGMVGLHLVVFVREPLAALLRDVRAARVKSGVYGSAGNKGTVAVRFELLATSLCFLCVHLESGTQKAGQRVAQLRDALRCFDGTTPPIPPATDHDVFAVAGDLNVRLDLPQGGDAEAQLREALRGCSARDASPPRPRQGPGKAGADSPLDATDWHSFQQYDELIAGAAQHLRPLGIIEGHVAFPPTYRFVVGGDEYDPARVPAWCDRVLYKAVGMRLQAYRAVSDLRTSDHRPVYALLDATLLGTAADRQTLQAACPEAAADAGG